jgi:hypothetical protein
VVNTLGSKVSYILRTIKKKAAVFTHFLLKGDLIPPTNNAGLLEETLSAFGMAKTMLEKPIGKKKAGKEVWKQYRVDRGNRSAQPIPHYFKSPSSPINSSGFSVNNTFF